MQNLIKSTLEKDEINFQTLQEDENGTAFRMGFGLKNGRVDVIIDINTAWHSYSILAIFPVTVEDNKIRRVSELLNRINYGLTLGDFEIDFSSGNLRFKTTQLYEEIHPDTEFLFRRKLQISFETMDRFTPAIMSVIYANILPEQALAQLQNNIDPSMN